MLFIKKKAKEAEMEKMKAAKTGDCKMSEVWS